MARFTLSAQAGFSVVGEARDGAEALSLLEAHDADCLVFDVEMPGVGGFEALAELQRCRPGLPVILLSGFSDDAVSDRARREGAAAYLRKDNGLGQLAATIRQVTRQSFLDRTPDATEVPARTSPMSAASHPTSGGAANPGAADALAADLKRLEYVVSHDFAEPARILSGFSTLLSSRYGQQLDDSGRLFLDNIEGAAARLQGMIDDLLVFSRAGRADASLHVVALGAVVASVFRDVPPADAAAARLTAGDLPQVVGDAGLLTTVFAALVSNALLFNSSTTPTVSVAGRLADGSAVITVTDNGIGIAASHTENVFELFRRLNTREEYPGTGTGLTLCRRLLALQAGSISLTSSPGHGTTVTVTLPAAA